MNFSHACQINTNCLEKSRVDLRLIIILHSLRSLRWDTISRVQLWESISQGDNMIQGDFAIVQDWQRLRKVYRLLPRDPFKQVSDELQK